MHISWLGQTAVKLQAKPLNEEVVILIDPYRPASGNFPRNLLAHVALYTRGDKDSITVSGQPFIVTEPGEYETKGVLVTAVPGHEAGHTMLRIDTEQLSMSHLGMSGKPLTDEQLEVLSDVDILFVPVGGDNGKSKCYDPQRAIEEINDIEPRIVIPIAYKCDTDPQARPVESFLKAMGLSGIEHEKKVIIKKKDLPQEEMKVIVLAKE